MTDKHVFLCGSGVIYLGYRHFVRCNLFPILVVWSLAEKQIFNFIFFKFKTDCYKSTKSGYQSQLSYQKLLQLKAFLIC